jgi:hypothetical protein
MIDRVTSLADLFFKAKTNPDYVRLCILSANSFGILSSKFYNTTKIVETLEDAIEALILKQKSFGEDYNCSYLTDRVNAKRKYLVEPEPTVKLTLLKSREFTTNQPRVRFTTSPYGQMGNGNFYIQSENTPIDPSYYSTITMTIDDDGDVWA